MQQRYCFKLLFMGLLCVGLMFGAKAHAQIKNACSDDIEKFCKDIKPGQGSILECLEKHETELSFPCKNYESNMSRLGRREHMKALVRLRQVCWNDISQYCHDMKPESGGFVGCLTENESKLSDPCRETLQAARGEKQNKE
jgi:hypothetical protein